MLKSAFDNAHVKVCALVKKFQDGEKHFLSAGYQEAEVRQDFLDPFFIELGWDVRHEEQNDPYKREVRIEQGVSMAEGRKRADYAF